MPLPHAIKKRTSALNKLFDKCMAKLERLEAAERYDEYDASREQELNAIYQDACDLIRSSDEAGVSYCDELLDTLQRIIDEAEGETGDMYLGPTTESDISDYGEDLVVLEDQGPQTVPRDDLPPPHPRSNPFASFRSNLPGLTATPADHFAATVYDARCEIVSVRDSKVRYGRSKEADSVIDMQLSDDGSCLAVLGSVKSLKNCNYRHPWLACHYPDDARSKFTNFLSLKNPGRFAIGFPDVPTHMAMDEAQRLILVGDERRLKTFAWARADGAYYRKPLATDTMDSTGFAGPILTLSNGMILRAGQGAAAVWDTDEEECDENPTSQVNFANKPRLKPHIWKLLPDSPSSVLCTERSHNSCITIDLEDDGKTIARYNGHHTPVTHISASRTDPQIFLTSSYNDGYARVFDVRHQQPILALKVSQGGGSCGPIALAHPDGIPTVFTDGGSSHDFKVWDLRARACVYELGTPFECESLTNTLAWDSGYNTLYSWKLDFEDSDSDYIESGGECDEPSTYSRICRYAFKERPRYSMLPPDDPKVDEAEYFEVEYETEPPLDDSDEDYVD